MPRPRFRQKARPDQHGRPIPQHLKRNAQELQEWDIPCVVSPVDVAKLSEITNVVRFEEEYGKLLRSTPEYHGLRHKALKAALAKRTAIHLETREWVPDPIRVSDKALRLWLQKYPIPAGTDELEGQDTHGDVSSPAALDAECGYNLRKRIALGFTGYRAAERYLSAVGIGVKHNVVRRWYDVYGRASDDEIMGRYYEDDDGLRPTVTEADLRQWDEFHCLLRVWRDVEELSVEQASWK